MNHFSLSLIPLLLIPARANFSNNSCNLAIVYEYKLHYIDNPILYEHSGFLFSLLPHSPCASSSRGLRGCRVSKRRKFLDSNEITYKRSALATTPHFRTQYTRNCETTLLFRMKQRNRQNPSQRFFFPTTNFFHTPLGAV